MQKKETILNYLKRAKQFKAKKRLGQNFLVDENIVNKIIETAKISPHETVLEIGPGLGFVTERLAQTAKKVVAVEIDADAIEELSQLPYENIEIINQDILKVELSDIVDEPVKIVANIPYYITSPILVHLLGEIDQLHYKNRESVKEVILMVQYEVARRITATEKSANKEYGTLSLLASYWSEPEYICKVPANCFWPAPKVDSAVVKLKIRQKPAIEVDNPSLLRKIIQAGFGKRRKTLKNALTMSGFDSNKVNIALDKAGISPSRRGETLSLEEFAKLSSYLNF